jgi:transposase
VADEPARDVDDLTTGRALITTLQNELTRVQRENASLRHQLDLLCQRLFGKKSERVSPDQLRLAFAQLGGDRPDRNGLDQTAQPRTPAPHPPPGRRPLPPALPRERIEIDLPEAAKICPCGHRMTRIGEAVTETLEYVPASLHVIETARLKYACSRCHEGLVEAPAPPQAVEKSRAGEGLLAHVVVSKLRDLNGSSQAHRAGF